MQQLFLCYRRAGAQTAKLFSFYMRKNHPEIPVWYSDKETESNYALAVPELMRTSYGAVIFVSKDFTKGFINKKTEKINTKKNHGNLCEECITVQEIIEIERNIQTRDDFELHIINLDGAVLGKKERADLETVFRQAGILQPDSVARFAERNLNHFSTARDHEDAFFDRMIAAYLPNNASLISKGNFCVGNYQTTVDVLCWDCKQFIDPRNIAFRLSTETTPLYERIERSPLHMDPLSQDDDVLSVVRLEQSLTTNTEQKVLCIDCKICKYHLFKKTLDLWNTNGFNMTGEIIQYLNAEEDGRTYAVPNAMGLALMVVTADHKLVFSRRSRKRKVRSGEFDCSIVEGLLPYVDKTINGKPVCYDLTSPDYIEKECIRAFCEEICADDNISIRLFGMVLDRQYGQWNLIGAVRTGLTFDRIQEKHSTRDDTTEKNKLFAVEYLNRDGGRDLKAVKEAVQLYKNDGFWDMALAVLCGTLQTLGFTQEEIGELA